ncbi:SAV_6107 family HEPN domain-containing protein [uncultured Streptomyces sp.]|uniref:SAV_6107 family HEPN domain-containing protein n=1 Tax=uncultured Streptomyces sp. TaxID=174707 RepID=UPI0026049E7F|nr:SAV_6107 family HEPN domain-containing protein [uncultured Streptomyces sp.]
MARSSAAAAPRRRAGSPVPSPAGPPDDVHPVLRRAGAPPAALDLLAKAHAGLDEAAVLPAPHERYATAHLAALRAAAAVLAARGRPEATRRHRERIRSAWDVLPEIAPELTEWCALFAAGADRRARAEAGIRSAAGSRDADDLLRDAAMFLRLVERLLALSPTLPHPVPAAAPEGVPRPDGPRRGVPGPRGERPDAR